MQRKAQAIKVCIVWSGAMVTCPTMSKGFAAAALVPAAVPHLVGATVKGSVETGICADIPWLYTAGQVLWHARMLM